MNGSSIEGESLGEVTERTIYELDNDLRRRVFRNPALVGIFEKHGRQLTTIALYELAIALDNENQRLIDLAIKYGARSYPPKIEKFILDLNGLPPNQPENQL